MRKIKKWLPFLITFLPFKILSPFFKKKNYLFGTGTGKFHDNTKYLYLNFIGEGKKCFWVTKNNITYNGLIEAGYPAVKYNSMKHFALCLKAKAYFTTVELLDVFWHISPNTKLVQLWHGTPLKRINYDTQIDIKRLENKKKLFGINHSFNRINKFIIEDEAYINIFKNSFKISQQVLLPIGQPRNVILHENDQLKVEEIKDKLNLNKTQKIILFCPTYRDTFEDNEAVISSLLNSNQVEKLTSEGYTIILKLHPFLTNGHFGKSIALHNNSPDVIDLSSYDDIQELLLISDILITDYSSCAFDFAITKRPIFLFQPDYSDYTTKRGDFYIDTENQLNSISTKIKVLSDILTANKIDYDLNYIKFETNSLKID